MALVAFRRPEIRASTQLRLRLPIQTLAIAARISKMSPDEARLPLLTASSQHSFRVASSDAGSQPTSIPLSREPQPSPTIRPPDDSLGGDIARERQLVLDRLRRAYQSALAGTVPVIGCPFTEAIQVRIEAWDDRWWLVYEPYTWVDLPRNGQTHEPRAKGHRYSAVTLDESTPQSKAASWRRERWASRYNRTWHDIVEAWAMLIAPESVVELSTHYFPGSGVNAKFRLSCTTAWSSPVAVRPGGRQ